MNSVNTQVMKSYISDGDARKGASEWGAAKICYLKAMEEFNSIREIDPHSPLSPDMVKIQKEINERICEVDDHLAVVHRDRGSSALENKAWHIAIEELEEATRLAKDDNIAFLEDVKKLLDKARSRQQDHLLHLELSPFVERGDDFKSSGNYGEAILEFQAALKIVAGLPATHKFVGYIKKSLTECRRSIIRPYLAKIHRACHSGKFAHAAALLKRAQLLLDSQDNVYHAFLEQLKEKIYLNLKEEDISENEEFIAPEIWEQAVKDYEEALDLYSSFTVTDPFAPAYTGVNVFEDKFVDSRRKLGKLYKTRADKLRDQAKIEKAIRNYKEALRLLPRSDKMFHEAFKEMKKLRAQIAEPSV